MADPISDMFNNILYKTFVFIFYVIGRILRFAYDVIVYLIKLLIIRVRETPKPLHFFPLQERLEHTHIVGGSGHGKTQLLQQMILLDIDMIKEGGRDSIIIIDSQGDMIGKILRLAEMKQLSDRLVLIDPTDIDHPPALNLFDFGLERLEKYDALEREKLLNGAIALYEYLFGALLGAELTQRQGVVFRYLARLMMTVPNATIHTLMDFMQEPETVRPYLFRLDSITRRFFETQFFSKEFDNTRQQILTRLWGVLSNPVLARMFSSEHNKVDLFDTMNKGSIILINTAKDLLKQEGCEILGRFFIALICQAAQERAVIPEDERLPTFVYIDEAHDYFDERMGDLLNQARKFKVGLILAHQNLDQFSPKLRATVMASTSIKLAGGVSAKDAATLAPEMKCKPEDIQSVQKREGRTQFFLLIRNQKPVFLDVNLGVMEKRERLANEELEKIKEQNRLRYSRRVGELASPARATETDVVAVGKQEML